jgi:hypothetical protein
MPDGGRSETRKFHRAGLGKAWARLGFTNSALWKPWRHLLRRVLVCFQAENIPAEKFEGSKVRRFKFSAEIFGSRVGLAGRVGHAGLIDGWVHGGVVMR